MVSVFGGFVFAESTMIRPIGFGLALGVLLDARVGHPRGFYTESVTRLRLRLLGIGAMASPRYAPAGLLALAPSGRVMFDGGGATVPDKSVPGEAAGRVTAWLVTDLRSELIADIRRSASALGLQPSASQYTSDDLDVEPRPVEHTNHETWGFLLRWEERTVVWAPEFWTFPEWAAGADLMFADAAGWSRPIRFRGGVGGHAAASDTAVAAREAGVRRLVFAHVGRPTIRALDAGEVPGYGEIGREGGDYWV